MSARQLASGKYELTERYVKAAELIAYYAHQQVAASTSLGLPGFPPLPQGGTTALVDCLTAQLSDYQALVRELCSPTVFGYRPIGSEGTDPGVLAAAFDSSFLKEIKRSLLDELSLGFAVDFIPPGLDGLVLMSLGCALAATMTWRVGAMVSLFFLHGETWISHRKATYFQAKALTGRLSATTADRVKLDALLKLPAIHDCHVKFTAEHVELLLQAETTGNPDRIRATLRRRNYPDDIVEEALAIAEDRLQKTYQASGTGPPRQQRPKTKTAEPPLDDIPRVDSTDLDFVRRFQVELIAAYVETIADAGGPVLPWDRIRETLRRSGCPEDLVEAAVARAANKVVAPQQELGNDRKDHLPIPSMLPKEFARQLFAHLPAEPEQRLLGLGNRLDEYRAEIREKLQKYIREYVHDRNPSSQRERQRSVDVINGMMKRLGFALEHPDHPGQKCYLALTVSSGNPQGQIRLLAEGSTSKPLDLAARLSKFEYLRVIDAAGALEGPPSGAEPAASPSWSTHVSKSKPEASGQRPRRS